ncbi:MAG: type IV secretory system conjugative DNA transfer family protein [Lachnospiraceae bacterium]
MMMNGKKQKQKRKRKQIVLFIVSIAVSQILLVAAVNADKFLTYSVVNKTVMGFKVQLNYLNTIQAAIGNKNILFFWLCGLMAYSLFVLWILATPHAAIQTVETIKITENLEIPVAVGNGQHGTARFLTDKEKKTMPEIAEFIYGKEKPKNGGIIVEHIITSSGELIRYIQEDIHTLMIGATRAGKGRRVFIQSIGLNILAGENLLVFDAKGELYYFTHRFAEENGYQVLVIDYDSPDMSIHFNNMEEILDALEQQDIATAIDLTWDIVSVLVGELKDGAEPLWTNGEYATIAAAILIVAMEAPKEYRNMTNVYYFLMFMCRPGEYGEIPFNDYMDQLTEAHPAKAMFAMAQVAYSKTRSSFFSSALGTLKFFSSPKIAEMASKSDFKFADIAKKKTIIYIIVPDERKTLYGMASLFTTQWYIAMRRAARENGNRVPIDWEVMADEIGQYPKIPELPSWINVGAGAGIRFHFALQDLQQFESKYKNDYRTMRGNCQNWIYLKTTDDNTLEILSKRLGPYTAAATSSSSNISDGTSKENISVGSSQSMVSRNLLTSEEIGRIDTPSALMLLTGRRPGMMNLPDLQEYQMNQDLGLGDKKHNQNLIKKEREERKKKARTVGMPKLWGIWKNYLPQEEEQPKEKISFL